MHSEVTVICLTGQALCGRLVKQIKARAEKMFFFLIVFTFLIHLTRLTFLFDIIFINFYYYFLFVLTGRE